MSDFDKHDDEALARMRAADPAIGAHPDLHAVRNEVAARLPAEATAADTAVRVRETAFGHGRASMAAAAAVVALGMGAGGYALGHGQQGGQSATAGGAPASSQDAVSEQSTVSSVERAQPPTGTKAVSPATGGAGAESSSSSADMSMATFGSFRLVAGPGLSDEASTAEIKQRVAPEQDLDTTLQAWATAQGADSSLDEEHSIIDGKRSFSGWGDATTMSLSYFDESASPTCWGPVGDDALVTGSSAYSEGSGSSSGSTAASTDAPAAPTSDEKVAPDDPATCPDDAKAPSMAQARAMIGDVLDGSGLSVDDFELTSTDGGVTLEVSGSRGTESRTVLYASVTADGVNSLSVDLSDYVSLGDYPVISAVDAVARYGKSEYATNYAYYVDSDAFLYGEPRNEAPQIPTATVTPGGKIPFWITEATITDAKLIDGYLSLPGVDGTVVPVWELKTADGTPFHVIALDESVLDTTP